MMAVQNATFYELDNPPRVVREAHGRVHELTPGGWRLAPWLAHAATDDRLVRDEAGLQRRCLQRLNPTGVRDDALRDTWASTRYRILLDWIEPPLPFGAPVSIDHRTRSDAAKAYESVLRSEMGEDVREELLQQANDGYRIQETRVAGIEARAGAFEGYAAAAAGLAAVGAALLGGTDKFGGRRDYFLLVVLGLAVICLVLSGFRAYQAAAKRFDWPRPNEAGRIVERADAARDDRRRLQSELLAALLLATTRGELLADWKLDRFKQASRYFSFALIWVIIAALLLLWPEQR